MVDPQHVAYLKLDEPAVAELLLLMALYDLGSAGHVSELLRHIDERRYFRQPSSRLTYAVSFHLLPRGYVEKDGNALIITESGKVRLRDLCELAQASPSCRLALARDGIRRFRKLRELLQIYPFTNGQPVTGKPRAREVTGHCLYVILLHEHALKARYRIINRESERPLPCLYVGMSQQSPLERFEAHRYGNPWLGSKYVRRYGMCLVPLLYSGLNSEHRNRAQAMAAERRLAEELRRHHFPVFAGHHDRLVINQSGT